MTNMQIFNFKGLILTILIFYILLQDCSEAALGENLTRLQNSSKQATVYIRLQEYWVLYLCCFVGASAGLRGDKKKMVWEGGANNWL